MDDEHHSLHSLCREQQQRLAMMSQIEEGLRLRIRELESLLSRHADEIGDAVPPIGGSLDNILLGGPVEPGE